MGVNELMSICCRVAVTLRQAPLIQELTGLVMGGRNQVEVEPLNHRGHEGRMQVIGYRKPATAGLRQATGKATA